MPQPPSIKKFDIFFLAALAAYAIGFFLSYDQAVAMVREQYAQAGVEMNPSSIMAGFFIFWIALSLLLWWLISAKRSNGAKWTLIVLYALLELIGTIYSIIMGTVGELSIGTGLSLLSIVLKGVAIYFLFQPDTKPWFDKSER